MSQEDKVFLNMAGEFAVASELNRRHILASVTYGSSKSADVFAMNRTLTKTVRIEVKTTDKRRWPVGAKATRITPESSDVFWVFVYLPSPLIGSPTDNEQRGAHSPKYFILSAQEVYDAVRQRDAIYEAAFVSKHGHAPGLGVPNLTIDNVRSHEGRWDKIVSQLNGAG